MHDRRIDGQAVVFGNQGWLYMRAMTWWDHGTGSIWSQPLGRALAGPRRGTTLALLPSALVPWDGWRMEHPATLVLQEDGGLVFFRETPRDDFVLGVVVGDHARAYRYPDAAQARVLNDRIGPYPLLVYTDPDTRRVQMFLRTLGDRTLTFRLRDGALVDVETGSSWHALRGTATAGPLRGQTLRVIPHNSSFDWAWVDFYPHTTFYAPRGSE